MSNRDDPRANKALAVRLALSELPDGSTDELLAVVREKYGHADAREIDIFLQRSKQKQRAAKAGKATASPTGSPAEAIETARKLIDLCGSTDAAIQTINAVGKLLTNTAKPI